MIARCILFMATLTGLGGCLDYSPYDGLVCRTGRFERFVFEGGELVRQTAFFPFDDEGDDLGQCSSVEAVVIQGTGTSADLQDLRAVTEVDRLNIGPTGLLSNVSGLDALATVAGDLTIVDNVGLRSLAGLGALRQVEGGIAIEDNPGLPLDAVESMLSQLEVPPATISVAGVAAEGDSPPTTAVDFGRDRADQLVLVEGISELLDVHSVGEGRLLITGRVSNRDVRVLAPTNDPTDRMLLASTSTGVVTGQGVALLMNSPDQLGWDVFFDGDWPLSFDAQAQVQFSALDSAPETVVYAGWVVNGARIGERRISGGLDGEGLWVGTIDSDGLPASPRRVDLSEVRDVRAVLAVKAVRHDRIWVLVRAGSSRHRLILVDLDDLGRSTSIEVGRGPIRIDSIDARPDGAILSGVRTEPGNVILKTPVTISGPFGFVLRIAGTTEAGPQDLRLVSEGLARFSDGVDGTRAPDCLTLASGTTFLSMGTDISGSGQQGKLEEIDETEDRGGAEFRLTRSFNMVSVAERVPLGLPFDLQLGCDVLEDGRLLASGLDSFARALPGGDRGWRLSTLERAPPQLKVRELTLGRIEGAPEQLREIRSEVSSDGTALLFGRVPTRLNLTFVDVTSLEDEFFIATRRVFEAIP